MMIKMPYPFIVKNRFSQICAKSRGRCPAKDASEWVVQSSLVLFDFYADCVLFNALYIIVLIIKYVTLIHKLW